MSTDLSSGQVLGLSLILQLQQRIRCSHNLEEAAFITVNETKQLLQYRQAALWIKGRGVVALSGLPLPERNSPYLNLLSGLFPTFSTISTPTVISAANPIPEKIISDWHEWLPAEGLMIPLATPDSDVFGLLLLARDEAWQDGELPLATELGAMYGHGLTLHLLKRPLLERIRSNSKPAYLWAALAILLTVLLVPVHLSVLAPAEVVAKDPFLVRAPQDGVIENFYVRPNQPVKAGQLLFNMDKTNLRSRIGMARKSYEVAAEEYRQAAVLALQDDKGKTEIMPRKGRMEERAVELSGTNKLLQRSEAVAPHDGIAVFNDPTDWVGKGVTIGEKVLLIADPAKAELLIRLPVADAIALEPGTRAILYLANDPQHPHVARLSTASFRSDVMPGGIVGYRLKADFIKSSDMPRIGLSGVARIYGKKVSLGYALFRRPLTAARQRLGW